MMGEITEVSTYKKFETCEVEIQNAKFEEMVPVHRLKSKVE